MILCKMNEVDIVFKRAIHDMISFIVNSYVQNIWL